MKKIICFMLIACVAFTGCTSDEVSSFGDVYGIISDTKSGSPIRNAEITISPGNSTTVSGSDGHFEFKSLEAGQYKISVTADGYSSNSRQVTIVAGQSVSCDIHLTPQNNDVVMITPTSLDFGVNELQLATTITNESDSETEWFLDLGNTPWLYAYPTTGRIGGGKTHSIVFTANRARMKEDKSSVVNISAFGDTHPLSLKCKQSVQLSSVMVVESLNVDFGEEATEQIIRIRNISETDVNWTLWGNDSGYLTMSATHGIVAPGNSQIVTISLNREELNEVLATTFKISDGTVDQPVNVIAYPTPEGATTTNKIFYTSTDGNIVEPYDPSVFGANIVSNTYEYGQGVITFDGDVTAVGKSAFQDCENLQSIHLPDGVTTIGESAFYNCGNLVSLNVPNGATSIERVAFYHCNNLISIILPESVTYIGHAAFAYCSSLTSINIPDSVISIGNTTFYDCSSLTSIDIPDGVTSIGNSAFSGCSGLTSIEIPESVTYIGGSAFGDCTNLTSINIPEGVTAIEEQTFVYCSNLSEIVIPESMVSIGPGAFAQCSSLTSINIPKGVTTIEERAFLGCSSIMSINIPDGVTTIGRAAFYDCSSLTSINIPNGVVSIENQTFYGCSELTSITIGSGITSIGDYAFYYCSSLTSITLPENLTSIGDFVFYNNGLTSINIPDAVTSIGYGAFDGCSKLTSINIPDAVTSIGATAFMNCSSLARVDCLPTTPPMLGERAFNAVSADCKIYVPAGTYDAYVNADGWAQYKDMIVNPNPTPAVQSQIFYTSTDGAIVTPYNTSAFLDADDNALSIVSNVYEDGQGVITIDGKLSKIGNEAFYNCSNLTSINIPDTVTSIGSYAFYGCSGLTSIDIPDGVTLIEVCLFQNCSSLMSVDIPNGVTLIKGGAFIGCIKLASINIPDSVTSIEERVFEKCIGLTSINIPDSVTSIGFSAFFNCSGLTSVNISGSVTSIEEQTFYGCTSLTSIDIPEGVTSIGYGAFMDCYNLVRVNCSPIMPPAMEYDEMNSKYTQFDRVSTDCKIYVPTTSVDAYKAAEGWSSYADAIVGYDF